MFENTVFSVLDLSPIIKGGDAAQAFANTVDLAKWAENLGYSRYWLAEHHNMPGLACAATAVLVGHVAGATTKIKVGAGGIMLPNHSPLIIAEQFSALATLYPGRIELALGRAPGTDNQTMQALRRSSKEEVNQFPKDVLELQAYVGRQVDGIEAVPSCIVPGQGSDLPMWILGSSLYGAQLAAALGLPYGFASHFAPSLLTQAIEIYRETFKPSNYLDKPYVLAGFNVFAAENDETGRLLMSSAKQAFLNLRRGKPIPLQPPLENFDSQISETEKAFLSNLLACSAVGGPDKVKGEIEEFIKFTGVDELMIASQIYDHNARLKSYQILAENFS
ncbi:MAG: alkane 1-monooxygenase [Rhodospirillaceae bacterium]|nr:alkane 1-monooxygenase [Alphaproteobacteria bacterium]MBR71423.1 alkane 1-monooxygenase [Rhodospirillaceae bacterium]|tara:strand:+ start:8721 stop:9722 length:1002 start_codon:yes stop_codon:yes gene_type:complete